MIDHEFEFLIIYKHDKLRKNYGHDFKIKILVHDPTKAMTIFCQNWQTVPLTYLTTEKETFLVW